MSGKREKKSSHPWIGAQGFVHKLRGVDGRGMMMHGVLPFFEGGARDLVILRIFCFIQQAVKTYGCH